MATQLLDDLYAPITSEVGFLECDAKVATDAFKEWQHPIQFGRGVHLNVCEVFGDLPTKIKNLLPLTSVEARRFLFLPTKNNWTAFLDNGWRGTDVFSTISHLATVIGCEGIRAVCVPHTIRKTAKREIGRFGATMLEVYASNLIGCYFLNIRRSLSVANDGGRWRFDANGDPLNFEKLEWYNAGQIRDRFTPDLLQDYLSNFGIRFFAPDFYESPRPAYLVSKQGPCPPGLREFSLEEARSSF